MDARGGTERRDGEHCNMMIEEEEQGNDMDLKQKQSTGGYDGMQVLMEVASHESDARLRSVRVELLQPHLVSHRAMLAVDCTRLCSHVLSFSAHTYTVCV